MGPPLSVIYVSYDGALDALGASQVVPYLLGLAKRGFAVTLISFEKPEQWRREDLRGRIQARLDACSVRWRPIRYNKRPRVPATLWDILVGSRIIASEAQRAKPVIVHCRGDIAMVMARWAGLPRGTRLLYDVRGFFSDERVETGSWRRGSVLDLTVKRLELGNLRRADGAVVLTRRAAERLRQRRPSLPSIQVIPTCADESVYTPPMPGQKPEFGLVYSGSLGTWYMGDEMRAFAESAAAAVPGRTLFLTPDLNEARRLGPAEWAEIRSVEPGAVADWLRRARALFFFIRPIPSKRASCPTKFAEGLASGLPVVCNRGIGDLDEIVEEERVGVLVDNFSEAAYVAAAQRLGRLLEDPALSGRCRRLAAMRYSVRLGVDAYCQLYDELTAGVAMTNCERGGTT